MPTSGNIFRQKIISIIYLIAISIYPFVNFLYENRGEYVDTGRLAFYAAATVGFAVIFCILLSSLTKRPFVRLSLPLTVFLFWFFSFYPYEQLGGDFLNSRTRLFSVWIPVVVVSCWVVWRYSRREILLHFI